MVANGQVLVGVFGMKKVMRLSRETQRNLSLHETLEKETHSFGSVGLNQSVW